MLSVILNKTNWLLVVVGAVALLFVLAFGMLVLDPDAVNRLQEHSLRKQADERVQRDKRHQ